MKSSMKMCLGVLACTGGIASAQWDPNNGEWLKSHDTDLRVMTWNVQDGICRTNTKDDTFSNWNAIVRLIASMRPDVLILQECGDNSGNGTGSGVDSTGQLSIVADLLVHGGSDIFMGGTQVGSYVPGARTHFRSTVLETKEVSR